MQITIREANTVIGPLDSAYNGILLKGYFLPKRSSSIITTEYLFKVMTNKQYRIKLSDVRIGQLFQKANSKVLSESLLLLDVGKPWGFDQDHYPDKVWMINVLYTLNSNHQLFKNSIYECQSILTQEDLKMIQTFNTSFARFHKVGFLKGQRLNQVSISGRSFRQNQRTSKTKCQRKKKRQLCQQNKFKSQKTSKYKKNFRAESTYCISMINNK